MLAAAAGRSSEAEASVKADEGPLDMASIAAPARTATAPPDKVRETIVILLFIHPLMIVLPSELDVNVLWRVYAGSPTRGPSGSYSDVILRLARP